MQALGDLIPLLALLGIASLLWHLSRRNKPSQIWETTPGGAYEVIITGESLACTHPSRPLETVRLDGIVEIRLVTTSDGPLLPDQWFVFVGRSGGCSIPSEAKGFEQLWPVFEARFPGFDYEPITTAGTEDSDKVLWKKEDI